MALSKEELIEEIKQMSVIDLSEVVKALEEEFGVSAAAPVAVAAADPRRLAVRARRAHVRAARGGRCRRRLCRGVDEPARAAEQQPTAQRSTEQCCTELRCRALRRRE